MKQLRSYSLFYRNILFLGYGEQSPLSGKGKLFCIVYCVVGIPLTLLILSTIVQVTSYFSVCLSIYLYSYCLQQYRYLSIFLYVCLSIYLFILLTVCLSSSLATFIFKFNIDIRQRTELSSFLYKAYSKLAARLPRVLQGHQRRGELNPKPIFKKKFDYKKRLGVMATHLTQPHFLFYI